jgi:hypothetical protein
MTGRWYALSAAMLHTACHAPNGTFTGQAFAPVVSAEVSPAHSAFADGIALGLHFEDSGRGYEGYLWEIARTGAGHVSLVIQWSMTDIRASEVRRHPLFTPTDEDVIRVIRQAKAFGLEVTLFPILWIEERADGEWRGRLAPEDPAAWFASYRSFVLHYAAIAAAEGVWALSVGSELGSMEMWETQWRALISSCREVFAGPLLYSANWDHAERTPFWDALDFIGVTGYYELATEEDPEPGVEPLSRAWRPIIEQLRVLSEENARPVLITEVGYVAQSIAAARPWDSTVDGDVDLGAHYEAFVALTRLWNQEPFLAGVFVWNWFGDGGSQDNGYTPRNKPSEQVLRRWFGGSMSGAR